MHKRGKKQFIIGMLIVTSSSMVSLKSFDAFPFKHQKQFKHRSECEYKLSSRMGGSLSLEIHE